MPSSINFSPARSVALNRSFTDDGCDQPAVAHHGSVHILPSPHNNMLRIVDEDGPSISEILGCNNTRTICGVKVIKDHKDSNSISGHGSRSSLSSHTRSLDDEASMNNSQSSHTSISQSSNQTGWNLETKLARSQERRKRLEGRFQRERTKRRTTENDRDQVLKFVKGLLLGLEEEEEKTSTRGQSSTKNQTCQGRISSIRDFVSQHERRLQGQNEFDGSSSHDDFDDYDDVHTCFPQEVDNDKIRILLSPELKEEEVPRPQSPTGSDYSSDSSYDTCEAQDEFPELPVKFRSIEELRSCDDATDDTSTLGFFSISDGEAREQDSKHTEEINKYKQELESLHIKLEASTQEHLAEIDSLERRFRDESLKRENLLERALTYAEHLEDTGRKKSSEIEAKQKDLELLAHQHFRKIEVLRRGHRDELRNQKVSVSKESAARHAKEVKYLKELFEEELKKQMKESNARHAEELNAMKQQHERDLEDLSKIHENSMQAQKEELLGDDGQKSKLQHLENKRLLKELQERDATIERLRAEAVQKSAECQKVQQTLVAHRSIIVSLEKQRKKKGRELQKARELAVSAELASSANLIRQLQEELRGRDGRIEKLEEQVIESKQAAKIQSDNNIKINSKLLEQLQERVFEIDTLRNEHSDALKQVETRLTEEKKKRVQETSNGALQAQRLKKQLEETEDYHMQELQTALRQKDAVLENLEAYHAKEIRRVQIVLDETNEKHARDVAALVVKMNSMSSLDTLEKPSSPTRRSSYHRSRIEQEYDVSVGIKTRMTMKKAKKKRSLPSLFTQNNAVEKPAAWVDLDSTSPTVSTSCSSLVNDFYEDDDRSISTTESRSSLPPRPNEVWSNNINKGGIVTSFSSDSSGNQKRAPKNKLPPSLFDLVGGLVTHK